jgi:hypothetical protein
MKKSLVLAMAMALGVTASAYAANPFSDVPAGHWAYDSISKLAAAGVIEGYGDDTFRGDRLMTRYEMAQIVAKAMAKGANVDKLAAEFADELDALGVRVAALEKKADNVKITGYFRYHYENYKQGGYFGADEKKGHTNKLRSRIWFTGKVNDNWNYVGMLQNDQDLTDNVENGTTNFQRAYLEGRLGGMKVMAGRYDKTLVDGQIWGDRMDGIDLTYGDKVKFNAYYSKPTGEGMIANDKDAKGNTIVAAQHDRAWGVNAKAALGKKVDLSVGYDNFRDWSVYDSKNARLAKFDLGDSKIFNVGLKFKAKDFALGATYLHSNGGPLNDFEGKGKKNGFFVGADFKGAKAAKPGSWGISAKYYQMPAGIPGNNWATGNALGESKDGNFTFKKAGLWEGYKGWYVGGKVTVAKGMIASVQYWDMKGRESSVKNKALWTDLVVTF